jgi:hypothetical protein
MNENFAVRLYDDAIEIVLPGDFAYGESLARTETSVYRPPEIPSPERSEVEIAVTAIMVILAALAVTGSMYMNHKHNRTVVQRMRSNDEGGLVRDHSLQ